VSRDEVFVVVTWSLEQQLAEFVASCESFCFERAGGDGSERTRQHILGGSCSWKVSAGLGYY
jgi:hypothetical protein